MKWLVYLVSLLLALEICRTCRSVASIFTFKTYNFENYFWRSNKMNTKDLKEKTGEKHCQRKWEMVFERLCQHYKFPFLDINLFDK